MNSPGRVPPNHLSLYRMNSSATETCLDQLCQPNSRRGSVISTRRASELPSPRKPSISMLTIMVSGIPKLRHVNTECKQILTRLALFDSLIWNNISLTPKQLNLSA